MPDLRRICHVHAVALSRRAMWRDALGPFAPQPAVALECRGGAWRAIPCVSSASPGSAGCGADGRLQLNPYIALKELDPVAFITPIQSELRPSGPRTLGVATSRSASEAQPSPGGTSYRGTSTTKSPALSVDAPDQSVRWHAEWRRKSAIEANICPVGGVTAPTVRIASRTTVRRARCSS